MVRRTVVVVQGGVAFPTRRPANARNWLAGVVAPLRIPAGSLLYRVQHGINLGSLQLTNDSGLLE